MSDKWVPLSVRGTDQEQPWLQVLYEGVPPHLAPSLTSLLEARLDGYAGTPEVLQQRLQIDLQLPLGANAGVVRDALHRKVTSDGELLLDALDCLVDEARRLFLQWQTEPQRRVEVECGLAASWLAKLRQVLDDGNSAYDVRTDDDAEEFWGLQRRVDATMIAAAHDAFERDTTAGRLLAGAWVATFRRHPDLDDAYKNVMLAVESVAAALIPDDERPSIGKAADHLERTLDRWSVSDLDDKEQKSAATLHAMLQTLRQNHQRHVRRGGAGPEPVEQAEAEAVLFLGVTLVQWFERGHVRRVGTP